MNIIGKATAAVLGVFAIGLAGAGTATAHDWSGVARCESGGNWHIHTANGFEGGVQFLPSTWRAVKAPYDPPHAYQASAGEQIRAAERLLARAGRGQWPVCGRFLR